MFRYKKSSKHVPVSPTSLPPEAIPAWLHPHSRAYLKQRGVNETESEVYDLHFCDGGYWTNRIIIPMYDDTETLIAYQGRDISGTDPKRYRTEGPRPLYAPLRHLHSTNGPLVIVEGPFDLFAVSRAIPNVVAVLGVYPSASQIEAVKHLIAYNKIQEVKIWFDFTAIGEACAFQRQLSPYCSTTIILDKSHKDPGEYLCHEGDTGITAILKTTSLTKKSTPELLTLRD